MKHEKQLVFVQPLAPVLLELKSKERTFVRNFAEEHAELRSSRWLDTTPQLAHKWLISTFRSHEICYCIIYTRNQIFFWHFLDSSLVFQQAELATRTESCRSRSRMRLTLSSDKPFLVRGLVTRSALCHRSHLSWTKSLIGGSFGKFNEFSGDSLA